MFRREQHAETSAMRRRQPCEDGGEVSGMGKTFQIDGITSSSEMSLACLRSRKKTRGHVEHSEKPEYGVRSQNSERGLDLVRPA